jgi:TRAP-type mannitol/chloroaromatic compound transport system permease small subunit
MCRIKTAIGCIDALSTRVGRVAAWLIVVLTAVISWEVFSRYVLSSPHDWVFDASYMLYGALFMLAGAYALAQDAHVRGDFMYGAFSPRLQAGIDLALYLLFFLPGVVALVWAGYSFAADSWAIREGSPLTPDGPPQYPFKTVIPIAGAFLLLQGAAEILRCILCLREGEWPARLSDVREVDVASLRARLPGAAGGKAAP